MGNSAAEVPDTDIEASGEPSRHQEADRGVSYRSIAFGLAMALVVCVLCDVSRWILHGSYLAFSQVPMGNIIPFLFSMLISALLARLFGRRFAFSPSEWITVFSMGFISALGPTYGMSGYIIGLMVGPYYFATPENKWEELLHPNIPSYLFPTNEGNAMAWFYEGLPRGTGIPWGLWAVPLLWWFTFICATGFVCACASVLIRRQWSENERLVYPAMAPIVEMATGPGTGRRLLPEFMKGKAFWCGFALTSFVFGWNMIAWFYPQFPRFPTARARWVFYSKDFPPLFFFLSTVVICFSYFASLEVLFSIWFFDVLFIVEGGLLNRIGVKAISPYYGVGRYGWQTAGAFVALALWGVWISRLHLWDALRKALHPGRSSLDDSRELLSYRGALIGLVCAGLYMVVWLLRLDMEMKLIVLLIPAMLLVYTGISKILADSGLIYLNPPTSAAGVAVTALGGGHVLQVSSRVAMSLSSPAVNHFRGFAMGMMTHINRLGELVTSNRRRLFWGVCAAFVVGLVCSTLFTVWLGYTMGGYNFRPNYLIITAGKSHLQDIVNTVKDAKPIEAANYWFFLVGAGIMILLNLMRYRFVWWPFHPVGFALSGRSLARLTSSTILVAWLIKLVMLRLVGASFYRKSKPFFIGALVGYILMVAAGVVVDLIWFEPQGHMVHRWY